MGSDLHYSSDYALEARGHRAVTVALEMVALAAEANTPAHIAAKLLGWAHSFGYEEEGSTGPETFGP
jgi:hypothetical protein